MENNIKVSIIVPSYKRHSDLVGRAIKSLLGQTYPNIEIILVCDNAKEELKPFREELMQLVKSFNDHRIILIQNAENLGGAGSRNAGFSYASGEYITFLDDDDRYLENKIENQLMFILDNRLDMCFTNLIIKNEREEVIDTREYKNIKSFDNELLLKYHLVRQITGTPTFMLKKELFDSINGFEVVPMGQEYYLMFKIIESKAKIGYNDTSDVIAYRYDIEAISTGPGKITGQKKLFNFKKKYFKILSFKEKRYIRCRHYAVMAIAYKRNKKYFKMFFNLILSCLASPVDVIKEYTGLKRRNKKYKGAN